MDTIWRLTASLANSRGVQAATGRPASAGGVQARLMICTICSAVKVSGAPGRGASASTRAIRRLRAAASPSRAASCASAAAQRAPLGDRLGRTAEVVGQRDVATAGGGSQDDAGAEGKHLGTGVLAQQPFQHSLLSWCDGNGEWQWPCHRTPSSGTLSSIRVISSPLDHIRTPYGFPDCCTRAYPQTSVYYQV